MPFILARSLLNGTKNTRGPLCVSTPHSLKIPLCLFAKISYVRQALKDKTTVQYPRSQIQRFPLATTKRKMGMNSYQVTYVSHKYTFFACKNTSLLNVTASTAQIDSKATHGIHYAMCIVNSQLTISFATLTRHCRDCLFTQLMGTKTEKKTTVKDKKNTIGRLFQCQFHNGKCTAGMKVLPMEISF